MTADCGLRGLDLLDAVIAHIEAHPETWQQWTWRCETGMCLAGWAAELAGGMWVAGPHGAARAYLVPEPGEVAIKLSSGREGVPASRRALALLGLPDSDMGTVLNDAGDDRDLFDGLNDLDGIKAMRDDLRARAAAAGEPS